MSKTKTNVFANMVCLLTNANYLDRDSILWKHIDGRWVGRRAIIVNKTMALWVSDISSTESQFISWLHGKNADYTEEFCFERDVFNIDIDNRVLYKYKNRIK